MLVGDISFLYYPLIVLIGLYLGILFIINKIPNITVKALGWLAINHVTIGTNKGQIYIRKVKFKINVFRSRNSPLKLFNLELYDMEIKAARLGSELPEKDPFPGDHSVLDSDISTILTFCIPNRLYEILFRRRVLNRFNLHLYRTSVQLQGMDDLMKAFFDYARLESIFGLEEKSRFVVTIINGYVQKKEQPSESSHFKFIRNVEFCISCDTILSCLVDVPNKLYVKLGNSELSLSLGKMSLPIDTLMLFQKEYGTNKNRSKQQNKTSILKLSENFLEVFSSLDIKLEDFNVTYQEIKVQVSNLQMLISNKHLLRYDEKNLMDLLFFLTSYRLFHRGDKSVEIPSAAFKCTFEPLEFLETILQMKDGSTNLLQANKKLNFESSLTITKPSVDIYYDQIGLLFQSPIPHKGDKSKLKPAINYLDILRNIRKVSNKILIIDTTVNFHLPKLGNNEFHRGSILNIIVSCTLLSFYHKFFTKNLKKHLHKGSEGLHKCSIDGYFKLKSLKIDVVDNLIQLSKVNLLISYNIFEKQMSIKLINKDIKLKSINDIIFQLVRRYRNQIILNHNKAYASFDENIQRRRLSHQIEPEGTNEENYLELFNIIPSFISSFKFTSSNIQADIACKDGLPDQIVFDELLQDEVNLGGFRRGVSIKLSDIEFSYKYLREEISSSVRSIQCFTVSEYANELDVDSDIDDYNSSDVDFSDMSSLDSENSMNIETEEIKRVKRVLNVTDVLIRNFSTDKESEKERDINHLYLHITAIDGHLDNFLVWCSFYAVSLIKYFAPTIQKDYTKEEISEIKGPSRKLKLDVFIDSAAVIARLPNKVDILLEFDTVKMKNILIAKAASFAFARLYVVHPSTKLWTRLLTIKESIFRYNSILTDDQGKFETIAECIRLNIPHQFLFYTVIDNIITFVKSAKQIQYNFDNLYSKIDDFKRIMPHEKRTTNIPKVVVKSKIFGITLENDLFENELSYIYELGLIEQKARLKKLKLFEAKVDKIIANTKPSIDDKVKLTNKEPTRRRFVSSTGGFSSNPKTNSPLRKMFSESGFHLHSHLHLPFRDKFHKQRNDGLSNFEEDDQSWLYTNDQEANIKINNAKEILEKQFATSWIKKYKKFRSFKINTWSKRASSAWGEEHINPRIAEKFNILSYASGPHMMCGYFRDVDLTIDQARICDVDDFIYKYGKKQPRLDYSILIPLFISLKSSSLYVMLRDYPLPLLSFPSNKNPNKPTINFSGNFVINERLVQARDEMRFIFVPFSPAAVASNDESDNFYSVFVPRTLTPVKVILDMQCDLDTDRPCMITWCKAYSAGLLAALAAFDKFTKPKIDYSPIGWWDKIALLVHGKVIFNIANELCLHMKASTSPYELIGRSAGFVFCWKNNVSLRFNNNGKCEELIMLDSDDFVLAIPSYSLAERKSWNLFYEHHNIYSEENDADSKRFKKKVMLLTSSDRVRWVLGVVFERNKNRTNDLSDQQPRTSTFKAHYDVRVTSSDVDSYEDYRSDYIHIALSVVSKSSSGTSYNAAYFTPLIFHYFFHWWDTLTKHTSLPIKKGRLFSQEPVDITHVKMGTHVFTVKYQLVFEPISISHLYIHSSSGELDQQNKTAFTGLKGKFSTCAIDLHQRKEQIRYVNEKLNINNKILHLKMNEGGVNIDDADIRFVNAIFNEKSVRGYLATFMKDSNSTDSPATPSLKSLNGDFNTFSDWIENVDIFDNDNSWIDPADYVELHQTVQPSSYPSIRIMPFFFSPKFTYFREFSLHEDGPFPFGKEKFHNCVIGLEKPERTQAILLGERKKNVEREMQIHEELLPGLEPLGSSEALNDNIERIKGDIKICKEKLNIIESIKENFPDKTENSDVAENLPIDSHESIEPSITNHKYNDYMNETNTEHAPASEFHNRFVIHNPQLKWHNDLRDLFMEYIKRVGDRKSQVYFMSKKAVDLAEAFINTRRDDDEAEDEEKSNTNDSAEKIFRKEYKSGEEIMKNFNQQLNEIHNEDQEVEDKYLIKLIHPQIQMVSEKDINACILVTSTDVELRIVSINVKGMNDVVSENNGVGKLVESRYGVSFKDSHVFAFKKSEESITASDVPYGSKFSEVNWPPWLETETCYDSAWAKDQLVVERTSMSFLLMKPNHLVASDSKATIQNNEISLHVTKLVITANSDQYSSLYYVITDLLLQVNTRRDNLLNKLDKIVSLSDIKEFDGLNIRIKGLQDNIRTYLDILLKLNQRNVLLDIEEKEQLKTMEVELERMNIELFVLMNGLGVKSSKNQVNNKETSRLLTVEADQIIWHLLNEDKKPFIDFALARCRFIRLDSVDGANMNLAEVFMAQGFNLQSDAMYPELLTPHLDLNENTIPDSNREKPILSTTWNMLNHIGGIPIMQDAKVEVQPLKVQLDYHTTKKLFDYLFPKAEVSAEDEKDDILEFNEEIKTYGDTKKRTTNPFKKLMKKERNQLVESILKDSDTVGSNNSDLASSSAVSSLDDIIFRTDTKDSSTKSVISDRNSTDTKKDNMDDISIIMNRSSRYVSIVNLEIAKVRLSISFSAPKHLSILNVHDLGLTIPTLRYRNKMWSAEEFVLKLKKDIIKIILNHTGKILGNKFKPTKKKPKIEPLKQISNYASFLTLQDLQLKDEEELEEQTMQPEGPSLNLIRIDNKGSRIKPQLDTIVDDNPEKGST